MDEQADGCTDLRDMMYMTHKMPFYAVVYKNIHFYQGDGRRGWQTDKVINGRINGRTVRWTDRRTEKETGIGTNEDGRTGFLCKQFYGLTCQILIFAFKGCSWRPTPAHPRYADWHDYGIVDYVGSRPIDWYTWRCIILSNRIFIHPFFIRSFDFKGCSWQAIPAYPRYADWHSNATAAFATSRAF